jgi:hypothetical protein
MLYAIAHPEPNKRGRGNKGKLQPNSDFSRQYLDQARFVLKNLPEIAPWALH